MKFNLREFLGFCKHKWKEKERHNGTQETYYPEYDYTAKKDRIKIIQECIKCGKLKEVHI